MFNFVFALLLVALLLSTTAWAEGTDCPAEQPVTPKVMSSPETFAKWLQGNAESLKTVEDLICCLPQNYLKNYLVSHSGRAGQNGSPESPRIFLYDTTKNNSMILAFNGGEAYLNQPHNVELGFIKDNKKFDVYDIEFYKRFAEISEKNPARCLRCHADSINQEARPFVHMDATPMFVSGAVSCSPNEDEIQTKSQSLALDAIVKNPRFRCLDRAQAQATLKNVKEKFPKYEGPFADRIKKMKEMFKPYQKMRLARLIHDSAHYEEYKFALVGADMCPNFKIADWLPADVAGQHTSVSSLRDEIAAANEAKDWPELHVKLKEEQNDHERSLSKILRSDFDLRRGSFRPSFQSWLCPSEPSFAKTENATLPEKGVDRILGKFELDSRLRAFPSDDLNPLTPILRFLIEGRAIDTAGWTLAFNPKEDFQPFDHYAEGLIALEPAKGTLKALLATPKKQPRPTEPAETCEKLRLASLKSLTGFVGRKPSEAVPKTP
jgi:hypothetical protein